MLNAKSAVLFNRVSSSDQRDGFSLEAAGIEFKKWHLKNYDIRDFY